MKTREWYAQNLRDILKERNITITAFAARLGVAARTVHRWIEGEAKISYESYMKLVEVLEGNENP